MSKGNTTETDVLALIFNQTAYPWNAAVTLDINLHTANPDEGGTPSSFVPNYSTYAPVEVVRTNGAAGWTVSGNSSVNKAQIAFPICTSGSSTCTYVSISPHGTAQILYSGALNGNGVAVSTGIKPLFDIGALTITED
jgi:hypothetical protein